MWRNGNLSRIKYPTGITKSSSRLRINKPTTVMNGDVSNDEGGIALVNFIQLKGKSEAKSLLQHNMHSINKVIEGTTTGNHVYSHVSSTTTQ